MRIVATWLVIMLMASAAWGAVSSSAVQVDVSGLLNSDVIVNGGRALLDTSQSPIDSPAFAETNFRSCRRAQTVFQMTGSSPPMGFTPTCSSAIETRTTEITRVD